MWNAQGLQNYNSRQNGQPSQDAKRNRDEDAPMQKDQDDGIYMDSDEESQSQDPRENNKNSSVADATRIAAQVDHTGITLDQINDQQMSSQKLNVAEDPQKNLEMADQAQKKEEQIEQKVDQSSPQQDIKIKQTQQKPSQNDIYYKNNDPDAPPESTEQVTGNSKLIRIGIPSILAILIIIIMFVSIFVLLPKSDENKPPPNKGDNYGTVDTVTKKCYFDIKIDGQEQGRIIIGLFGNTVHKTVSNFIDLCNGINGKDPKTNYEMSYQKTTFSGMVTGQWVEGGLLRKDNQKGSGNISVNKGGVLAPENFKLKHSKPYLLSMVNTKDGKIGSEFRIIFKAAPSLDGTNVVFGEVIGGFSTVKKIEEVGTRDNNSREPKKNIEIYESGELPM